jgi:hypothetical protein
MKMKPSTLPLFLSVLLFGLAASSSISAPSTRAPSGPASSTASKSTRERATDVPPSRWPYVRVSSSVPMVARTVTLHFPEGASLGRLILVLARGTGVLQNGSKVGSGSGTVTVTVPPGYWLGFEPNHVVFEHPSLLNKVSPEGIECLRISFTSLDDKEDGMCDKVLSYASHFKNLRTVILTRSDATDAGVANVKGLTDIENIEFAGAPVRGSCFTALSTLPNLLALNCSQCQIEEKYFALLPKFKAIQTLMVNRCNLTKADFQVILKLSKLLHLCMASNSIVDDELIKSLPALKNLIILDVRDTKATPVGLTALKGRLNLKYLYLTDHGNSTLDGPRLERAFPGIQIYWAKRGKLDQDTQALLSPLTN